MNAITKTAPEIEAPEAEVLAVIERETALSVLTDPERADEFVKRVRDAVAGQPADIATAKGRKDIASRAFKVAQTKAALDKARLDLTAEWRKNTELANAAGKRITVQLEELKAEVRAPLTEWETAEEERQAFVKRAIAGLESAATVTLEDTVESVQARLQRIGVLEIPDEIFQEHAVPARALRDRTLETLRAAEARLRQEAENRAELERLRAEAKAREEREAAEAAERRRREDEAAAAKAAEEAAAKAKADAEDRAQREAEEQAERERQAAAKAAQEAEAKARAEEQRKADDAAAKAKAEADAKLAEERRQRQAAEAEAKRLADEKAAADRKAAAEHAAAERRQKDREHRGKIMAQAKGSLMAAGGIGEEAAKKIILAIVAGEIPAVRLEF